MCSPASASPQPPPAGTPSGLARVQRRGGVGTGAAHGRSYRLGVALQQAASSGPGGRRAGTESSTSVWTRVAVSDFGRNDPRDMPVHLFSGAIRIDYGSAVRADTARQNCSICPRYWYVDADFSCTRCKHPFTFTADEQRTWYEAYGFWVDSLPKHCPSCRRKLRDLKRLRQAYDRDIERAMESSDLELKKRLAGVIDRLYEIGGDLPASIHENRRRLGRQLAKLGERAG